MTPTPSGISEPDRFDRVLERFISRCCGYPGVALDANVDVTTRRDDRNPPIVDGYDPRPGFVCDVGFRAAAENRPAVQLIAGWATHVAAIRELVDLTARFVYERDLTAAAVTARAAVEMATRVVDCCTQVDDGQPLRQVAAWFYDHPDGHLRSFGYSEGCQTVIDIAATQGVRFEHLPRDPTGR